MVNNASVNSDLANPSHPDKHAEGKKKKEYNNLDSYWYITADKQIWNEPGTRPPPSTVETSFPKEPDLITKRTAKYNT